MAGTVAASPFKVDAMGDAGVLGQWNQVMGRAGAWGTLAISMLAGASLVASTGIFAVAWLSNGSPFSASGLLFASMAIAVGWACAILLLWHTTRLAVGHRQATVGMRASEQKLQEVHQ